MTGMAQLSPASWFTLNVECEQIEVTAMPHREWDPDWKFVDKKGHAHVYGTPDDPWPTLRAKHETWFDADGEENSTTIYKCRKCKREISPGTRTVPGSGLYRQFIPGPVTASCRVVAEDGHWEEWMLSRELVDVWAIAAPATPATALAALEADPHSILAGTGFG